MKEVNSKYHTKNQTIDYFLVFIENDDVVLKTIYQSNYPKIEVFILKNSGSYTEAKDVYQDAFVVLWKAITTQKFIPENLDSIERYLYKVAQNKWIDVLRSQKKIKQLNYTDNEFLVNQHSKANETEEDTFFDENIAFVLDAFKEIGSACQELLTTFYYKKKSLREIAVEFEIEENTARNKKYRCMEKLRELVMLKKIKP